MPSSSDERLFRGAIFTAVVLHLALFCIVLPEAAPVAHEAPRPEAVPLAPTPHFERPTPRRELPRTPRTERRAIPVPMLEPEVLQEPAELPPLQIDPLVVAHARGSSLPAPPPLPAEPAEPAGPVHLGPAIDPPVRLEAPVPQYTVLARKMRLEGTVVLQAVIGRDGRVDQIEVLKPLGLGLSESAVETVRRWRYEPATRDGRPIPVYLRISVEFQVDGIGAT